MGQMVEDILDGSCCALCGCYFMHTSKNKDGGESIGIYTHDYPVACWDCFTPDCGYQKSDVKDTF